MVCKGTGEVKDLHEAAAQKLSFHLKGRICLYENNRS